MAYVYADMDALAEYQQQIVQTLSTIESQIGCKEVLIEDTKAKIRSAIERAKEAECTAYISLRAAEQQLSEAEQRTRDYNSNLEDHQELATTPDFYYEHMANCEQDYAYAKANRKYAESTLSNFEAYVRNYEQQQTDGIKHFKKLLEMSGKFFESYIRILIEVKKCTAVSGNSSSSESKINSEAVVNVDEEAPTNPEELIKKAGKQWADSLPKEQYSALSAYTSTAYKNINETLRGISPSFQDGYKEKAIQIHQALSACSLPQACTVYRGASSAALGTLQNLPEHQLVGSFFSDNGFMSTSLNSEDSFGGDIKFIISVPAGAKGAYVGYLSQLGHSESEVLFDMGSVMQITKVKRDKNGQCVIYAQMM